MSCKNGVLEAPGLDFGGPGARFLRPRGSIWERSGAMFSRFLPRMPRLPRTPRTPAKTRPRSQMRQEWVGGGAPPPGGFNGIGAKLVVLASSVCWVLGNLPRLYRVTGHLPLGGLSLASLASVPTSQVECNILQVTEECQLRFESFLTISGVNNLTPNIF